MQNLNDKIMDKLGKLSQKQLTMIAVGMGVLAMVLVGLAVSMSSDSEDDGKTASEPKIQMARVVVAKQDIAQRSMIQETMLEVTEVPATTLPPDAVTDVSAVAGKPALVPIMHGDIITNKKFLSDPKMAGFVGLIPEDCRAISVGIDDITGVAGFAKPGDYVDVMIVRKDANEGASGEIFMQNVMLLAINKSASPQTVSSDSKGKKEEKKEDKKEDPNSGQVTAGDPPVTATLAMRAEDALRLAVATQQGTVYLVLRPYHPQESFVLDTEFSIAGKAPEVASSSNNDGNKGSTTIQYNTYTPENAPAASVQSPIHETREIFVWNGDKEEKRTVEVK
jgi:pilus assembly protein CpaB